MDRFDLSSLLSNLSRPIVDLGGSRTLIACVQDRRLTIRRQALRLAALAQGGPSVSVLREGFEPSSSAFGGPCSSG